MTSKSPQTEGLDRRFSFTGWTLLLGCTLATAFLIRVWALGSVPAGLHPDELAGIVGVLDELSHRAPLRGFFDYRIMYLPLYGVCEYLASLFFGFTATAYRFPAALFGVVTVYLTGVLTYRLTYDRVPAALAGASMAILPWDVTISRVGWEPAAMLPFLLGGLCALRRSIETGSWKPALLAGVLFGIGSYSYRAALPASAGLAIAMLACDGKRAVPAWRAIVCMIAAWVATLAPLILSVWTDRDFFWRDRRISTFADGVDAHSLQIFARNYFAHFHAAALFRFGDGNANHGPAFGVLYLWMLPWIIFGLIAVWRRAGASTAAFLTVWLALFPIGGAATDDGVPHFLRTLIGAPLACMLCAIGLAAAWEALGRTRLAAYRRALAGILGFVALTQFSAFCRAYFIDYIPVSARAYQSENAALFAVVRTFEPSAARVCFLDLNSMNSLTLFGYYMRTSPLTRIEGQPPACSLSRTLTVTSSTLEQPPKTHLVATVPLYDGAPADYLYLTNF